MVESTVGGRGWQRTFIGPTVYRPQYQYITTYKDMPEAFEVDYEKLYGWEAARNIGLGRWPTEAEAETELSKKFEQKVDIPNLKSGEILLGYSWKPGATPKEGGQFEFKTAKALDFMDYLAGKTVTEKYPGQLSFASVETPFGTKLLTYNEKQVMEAMQAHRQWQFEQATVGREELLEGAGTKYDIFTLAYIGKNYPTVIRPEYKPVRPPPGLERLGEPTTYTPVVTRLDKASVESLQMQYTALQQAMGISSTQVSTGVPRTPAGKLLYQTLQWKEAEKIAQGLGLEVERITPTTTPLDIDYIMQAGLQVKGPEHLDWFKGIVGEYGKPIPAYAIQFKQPSWKETTISGAIYTGEGVVSGARLRSGYSPRMWELTPEQREKVRTNLAFFRPVQEFGAGFVAIGESWVRPELTTPSGALIGKVFGKTSAYETGEVSPFYLVGGLFGTLGEAYVFGKGIEYAYQGIKAVTPEVIKQSLYSAKEAVRFSKAAQILQKASLEVKGALPQWTGSRVEMWLVRNIPPYTKYASKQLSYAEFGAMLPERIGMKSLRIEELVFNLANYPRGQIVYISKIPIEKGLTKSLPHLFYRAGKLSVGYLGKPFSFVQREATFTPLVSQTQLTRMGVHPYMPRTISTFTKTTTRLGTQLIPLITTALLHPTTPKRQERLIVMSHPAAVTYELEKLKVPQFLQTQQMKQRETLVPLLKPIISLKPLTQLMPKQALIPRTLQREKQTLIPSSIVLPKQVQTPKLGTIPKMGMPTPQRYKPLTVPLVGLPWMTLGGGGGGGTQNLWGKWFKRQHRIKTPKEVAQALGFMPTRKLRARSQGIPLKLPLIAFNKKKGGGVHL